MKAQEPKYASNIPIPNAHYFTPTKIKLVHNSSDHIIADNDHHQSGIGAVFFDTGGGDDTIEGYSERENIMQVGRGNKKFTGGKLADIFLLTVEATSQSSMLDGGEGIDTLIAPQGISPKAIKWRGYEINLDDENGYIRLFIEIEGEIVHRQYISHLRNIENAIGHDGSYLITGNDKANMLAALKGWARLSGKAGDDILTLSEGRAYGGNGADTYHILQNFQEKNVSIIIDDSKYRTDTLRESNNIFLHYNTAQIHSMTWQAVSENKYGLKIILSNENGTYTTLLLKDIYQSSATNLKKFELNSHYTLSTDDGLLFLNSWPKTVIQDENSESILPLLPPFSAEYNILYDQSRKASLNTEKYLIDLHTKCNNQPDSITINGIEGDKTKTILPEFITLNLNDTPFNDRMLGNNADNTFHSRQGNDTLIGGFGSDAYYIYHDQRAPRQIIIDNDDNSSEAKTDTLHLASISIDKLNKVRKEAKDIILSAATPYPALGQLEIRIRNFMRGARYRHINVTDMLGNTYRLAIDENNQPYLDHSENQIAIWATEGDDLITLSGAITLPNNTFNAQAGDDQIYDQGHGERTVHGGQGNDILFAGSKIKGKKIFFGDEGDDKITGGIDDDILHGGQGNDTLQGNQGDDSLNGGIGNDTYQYHLGDGHDVINDIDGVDTLQLSGDISIEKMRIRRIKNDVKIIFTALNSQGDDDESQAITIKDHYDPRFTVIEKIEIAGKSYSLAELEQAASVKHFIGTDGTNLGMGGIGDDKLEGNGGDDWLYGQEGRDRLYGGLGNDELHGDSGNDQLYGDAGDDTLIGGKGDDYLDGGTGNDTYAYSEGDGHDTIEDNLGDDRLDLVVLMERDIRLQKDEQSNLKITFNQNDKDSITFSDRMKYLRIEGTTFDVSKLAEAISSFPSENQTTAICLTSLMNASGHKRRCFIVPTTRHSVEHCLL